MLHITWTYADGDTTTTTTTAPEVTELHDLYVYLAETADFYGRTVEFDDNGTVDTPHKIIVRDAYTRELYATIAETITEED